MALLPERRTPTVQERVDKVIELIAQGYKRKGIHEWIQKNTDWNISKATIDTLIKKAKTDIHRFAKLSDFEFLNDAILNYKFLYKRAIDNGDIKVALQIQNSLSEMLNLQEVARKRFSPDPKPVDKDFLVS